MTIAGLLFIVMALALTFVFAAREARAKRDWFIPVLLCVSHIGLCLLYWHMSLTNGADSLYYWELASTRDLAPDFGTVSIVILVGWVQGIFGLFGAVTYLDMFLLFQIFGLLALFLLNETIGTVLGPKYPRFRLWAWVCILLPGLSFWSCAIGKDGLMLLSVCLPLYASLSLRSRVPLLAAGFLIAMVIRPHIAAAILLSVVVTIITRAKERMIWRVGLILVLVIAGIAFVPVFEKFLKLDALDITSISQSLDARSQYNMYQASGVNITAYSFPLKVFTFLFRPLFFDMSGLLGLAASIENSGLLLLIGYGFWRGAGITSFLKNDDRRYCVAFFIITTIVLSEATANLGLADRQKTMVLPALFMGLAHLLREVAPARKKLVSARMWLPARQQRDIPSASAPGQST